MKVGTILRTNTNHYRIVELLGRGAQGSVYKALRQDGLVVAIKLLRVASADALRRFQNEAWTYHRFKNNFVNLLDWSLNTDRPFLVLEFCLHGSARSQINFLKFWHSVTVPLLAQTAAALAELHQYDMLYRDFKPENLLITQDGFGPWKAKLGDAGLICLPPELNLIQTTQLVRGTPEYMAPELFIPGALYTKQAEAFAFGVTASELLSGIRPKAGAQVLTGPSEVRPLLTALIAEDPTVRPSLNDAHQQLVVVSQRLKERNRSIAVTAIAAIGLIMLSVGRRRND